MYSYPACSTRDQPTADTEWQSYIKWRHSKPFFNNYLFIYTLISNPLEQCELYAYKRNSVSSSATYVCTDAQISWQRFVEHHRQEQVRMDEPWTEADEQRVRLKFHLSDLDGDGVISWWEFLTHEAEKRLALRDKVGP